MFRNLNHRSSKASKPNLMAAALVAFLIGCPSTSFAQCANSGTSTVTVDQETNTGLPFSRQFVDGAGTTLRITDKVAVDANFQTSSETTSVSKVIAPAAPTVTATGTTGSTVYEYCIVAKDGNGNCSPVGPAKRISNGNSVLSNSNYNALSWAPVQGAASYEVYRTASPYTDNLITVGNSPRGVIPNQNGSKVFVSNLTSDSVSAVDMATRTATAVSVGSSPKRLAILPDGSKVFVACSGGSTITAIITSDNSTKSVTVGTSPQDVVLSTDGSTLYVPNASSSSLSIVNTSNYSTSTVSGLGSVPTRVALTPNGSKAYVLNSSSNNVSVVNLASKSVSSTISVGNNPTDLVVSPDGNKVFVLNRNDVTVSIISTSTDSVMKTIGTGGSVNTYHNILITPDGKKVYVSCGSILSVIDTSSNSLSKLLNLGISISSMKVSPDGSKIYCGGDAFQCIETATDTLSAFQPLNHAIIDTAAFALSADGTSGFFAVHGIPGKLETVSLLSNHPQGRIATVAGTSFNDQQLWTGDGTYPLPVCSKQRSLSTSAESVQQIDCSNGNVSLVLPDPTTCSGKQFLFKRIDSSRSLATVSGFQGQGIMENVKSLPLFSKAESILLQSDGSKNWRRLDTPKTWTVASLLPDKSRSCTDWGTNNIIVQGSDGKLYGWGLSTNGNLAGGITSGTEIVRPVTFDPGYPIASSAQIADWCASSCNLFVVLSDGSVYGAGLNDYGQLGNGSTTDSKYLQRIRFFDDKPVSKVWTFDAGSFTTKYAKTFFLTKNGEVYACGYNATGALGIGNTTSPISSPTLVSGIYNPADVKSAHTFSGSYSVLCDQAGDLYVTGYNGNGQLGTGANTQLTAFTKVTISGAGRITKVFAFGGSTGTTACGNSAVIDHNGVLYLAGKNSDGQLGQGNTTANTSYGWFKVASKAAYNTGTISASGTTVTGSGTSWTSIPAKVSTLQIGFENTNPDLISTWYDIESIDSATQLKTFASVVYNPSTPYVIKAIPIPNPVVDFVFEGNADNVTSVALDNAGRVWGWGNNGSNNLFNQSTSALAAPTNNISNAKTIAATRAVGTGVARKTIVWDGTKLHIGGNTAAPEGLVGATDSDFPVSGSIAVFLPQSIITASENIKDVLVNNNGAKARLFILTDQGNLYASGDNTDDVTSSGIGGGPASVGLSRIRTRN